MAVVSQDRTTEFKRCVATVAKSSQTIASRQQQRQMQDSAQFKSPKSQFASRAADIAKEIEKTTESLGNLSRLAANKSLFNDKPVEFNELTAVVKRRLTMISGKLQELKKFQQESFVSNNPQAKEHSTNVVSMLQNKVMGVTEGFEKVLKERYENVQNNRERTEQFISAAQTNQNSLASTSDSPLYSSTYKPANDANPYNNANSTALQEYGDKNDQEFLTLPQQQQQVLLEEQQDQYLSQRSSAIEAIESTIQELGGIFHQLSTMVAEQRETVQRIDENTEDISLNVEGAQRELLKYYARVSSNRMLLFKMFGILIFFFIVWALVT